LPGISRPQDALIDCACRASLDDLSYSTAEADKVLVF
jgi:hypothetical protein